MIVAQGEQEFVFNSTPYFESVPSSSKVAAAGKKYLGNTQLMAQLTDDQGELHPVAMFADPQYIAIIDRSSGDTTSYSITNDIQYASYDNQKAVVDLVQAQAANKEKSFSILIGKDLDLKFPSDEKLQKDGFIEANIGFKSELGTKVCYRTTWYGSPIDIGMFLFVIVLFGEFFELPLIVWGKICNIRNFHYLCRLTKSFWRLSNISQEYHKI